MDSGPWCLSQPPGLCAEFSARCPASPAPPQPPAHPRRPPASPRPAPSPRPPPTPPEPSQVSIEGEPSVPGKVTAKTGHHPGWRVDRKDCVLTILMATVYCRNTPVWSGPCQHLVEMGQYPQLRAHFRDRFSKLLNPPLLPSLPTGPKEWEGPDEIKIRVREAAREDGARRGGRGEACFPRPCAAAEHGHFPSAHMGTENALTLSDYGFTVHM